jgi:hypothetical protein
MTTEYSVYTAAPTEGKVMQREVMFFPKELWESSRRRLEGKVWTLFTVVIEETYGYGKLSAEIPISRFLELTSMSENQIRKYLPKMCSAGLPMQSEIGPNGGTFSFEEAVRNGTLPQPLPREFEKAR